MMRTIDLRSTAHSTPELRALVPRAALDISRAVTLVAPLITDVKERGEQALREQAAEFDGVTGHALRVAPAEIRAALAAADPELIAALKEMIARVRRASAAQVPAAQLTRMADGAVITQRWQPVDRVGLYVPGGKAVYPSSVVMNAVAAQTAGVKSLALASPAQRDTGGVHPTILAAAALCGIDEIYAIGGAGAIAAFAHGVPGLGLDPVDVICGPGNIYVAAAKRVVAGSVGIDSEAGTTEIMVLADSTANSEFVAADLLSQAEHDEAAASVLVTDSEQLAAAVTQALATQLSQTRHRERASTALSGPQSAIILAADRAQMAQIADAYAAEHLSLQTANPEDLAAHISNAGAVFIGPYTPVSLGDYLAGSNHVLPTGGTARFSAGLGAHTFLRPQQLISYSAAALATVTPQLVTLAEAEGLPAHGAAAALRQRGAAE